MLLAVWTKSQYQALQEVDMQRLRRRRSVAENASTRNPGLLITPPAAEVGGDEPLAPSVLLVLSIDRSRRSIHGGQMPICAGYEAG